MSSTSKAWAVAASIGVVEALKDQIGVCRWNFLMRSAQQHLRNNVNKRMRSLSQANTLSSSVSTKFRQEDRAKQSEESIRTVMYLSCWGPN